jgi:heptosyltransferase-2
MLQFIRREHYDKVINLHRFASSGFLTAFSGAQEKIGFSKNPLSWTFDRSFEHQISSTPGSQHEVERNLSLISHFTDDALIRPRLYPSKDDYAYVKSTIVDLGAANNKYITLAPASVWFTKQLPESKWVELIQKLPHNLYVYLIGAPADKDLCERIHMAGHSAKVINWAGKFSLLQSAVLMKDAVMNYVNDSAPLHLASSMNAPVTAFFCSTVPEFGFGPLSDEFKVLETNENLSCRPCGLHGKRSCPKGHFKCSQIPFDITIESLDNL